MTQDFKGFSLDAETKVALDRIRKNVKTDLNQKSVKRNHEVLDTDTKTAIDAVLKQAESYAAKENVAALFKTAPSVALGSNAEPPVQPMGRCQKTAPCFKSQFQRLNSTSNSSKESPLLKINKPLVFISASMPKEALLKLSMQAKNYNARLVMRGMVEGSMLKTAQFSKEIGHPVDLDPKLFEQFNITKVPVFIVKTPEGYKRLSGNVELSWAIDKMKEKVA